MPRLPLLICGATGTLGRALASACRERDIAHVLTSRTECDLHDPASVAAALDRHQPWAVINATGWLTDEQVRSVTPDAGLQKALRGGCHTAIVSPEGKHLAPPLTEGEGMVIADLDMALIAKRKRMMDSVGHYARPELLSLALNDRPATPVVPMSSTPSVAWSPDHEHAPRHERHAVQPPVDDPAPVLRVAAG